MAICFEMPISPMEKIGSRQSGNKKLSSQKDRNERKNRKNKCVFDSSKFFSYKLKEPTNEVPSHHKNGE